MTVIMSVKILPQFPRQNCVPSNTDRSREDNKGWRLFVACWKIWQNLKAGLLGKD